MTKDNTSEISFEFPAFEFHIKQEQQFNFKAPMKRIHKENKSQNLTKLITELHELSKQIKVEQMMRRRQIIQARRFVLIK